MRFIFKAIVFLVILIIVVVGIGYFALNTGEKVETLWSEGDFNSGIEKSKIQIGSIEEINLETLAKGDFTTNGANDIDEFFTCEEMSALVSMANDSGGPLKNFSVSFGDNGNGAVSFDLSERFTNFLTETRILDRTSYNSPNEIEYIAASIGGGALTDFVVNYITNAANNKPVYATGNLSRDSANSVNVRIDSLYVGRISMNQDVVKRVEWEVERIVNMIISPENGFHIEELKVENGKLYFKGTLPDEVEGVRL